MKEQLVCLDRLFRYNQLLPSRQAEKTALLQEMFAEIGERDREYYFKGRKIPKELYENM